MRNLKKKLLVAAAASAVTVALPVLATHTWGNASGTYHWDGASLPVQLSVIDSVTNDWQDELDNSIVQWNVSSSLNLAITSANDSAATRSACAIANGEIRVCNDTYGSTGWSGLASLNIDSNNHILWGTAKVNDSYSMGQADRNKVMCQEIGHLFGLGHTSENGTSQQTCMDYANDPTNSQWPNAHDYELLDQIYAHIGGGGGGGGGGTGELANGVTESNISGASGSEVEYYIDVPAGATDLSFAMSGGSGDADLYVKFGSAPTTSSYDCRPYKNGNSETCSFSSPSNGRYYVMIRGYSAYSGVNLTASFTEGGGGGGGGCVSGNGVLCNGVAETNISGARRSETRYYIDVPAGASNLSFAMSGGSGDADLYVKYGSEPSTSSYDCRPYRNGNNETCNFSSPSTGRYYVMIRGYSAYSGVSLTASYDGGAASASSAAGSHDHRRGKRVEANANHEIWVTKNADNTMTITRVILAGKRKLKH